MFSNEYFSDWVSAWAGGGGSANTDSCRQGEGGQKSIKMCGHPLGWPLLFRNMGPIYSKTVKNELFTIEF